MRQMTVRSNIIHSVTQQTYFLNLLSYLNMLRDVLSYTRFLSWTLNTPIFCKMAARSQVCNFKRSYSLLVHTPLESSISFLNFLTNSKLKVAASIFSFKHLDEQLWSSLYISTRSMAFYSTFWSSSTLYVISDSGFLATMASTPNLRTSFVNIRLLPMMRS